jgi:hypothetical protein
MILKDLVLILSRLSLPTAMLSLYDQHLALARTAVAYNYTYAGALARLSQAAVMPTRIANNLEQVKMDYYGSGPGKFSLLLRNMRRGQLHQFTGTAISDPAARSGTSIAQSAPISGNQPPRPPDLQTTLPDDQGFPHRSTSVLALLLHNLASRVRTSPTLEAGSIRSDAVSGGMQGGPPDPTIGTGLHKLGVAHNMMMEASGALAAEEKLPVFLTPVLAAMLTAAKRSRRQPFQGFEPQLSSGQDQAKKKLLRGAKARKREPESSLEGVFADAMALQQNMGRKIKDVFGADQRRLAWSSSPVISNPLKAKSRKAHAQPHWTRLALPLQSYVADTADVVRGITGTENSVISPLGNVRAQEKAKTNGRSEASAISRREPIGNYVSKVVSSISRAAVPISNSVPDSDLNKPMTVSSLFAQNLIAPSALASPGMKGTNLSNSLAPNSLTGSPEQEKKNNDSYGYLQTHQQPQLGEASEIKNNLNLPFNLTAKLAQSPKAIQSMKQLVSYGVLSAHGSQIKPEARADIMLSQSMSMVPPIQIAQPADEKESQSPRMTSRIAGYSLQSSERYATPVPKSKVKVEIKRKNAPESEQQKTGNSDRDVLARTNSMTALQKTYSKYLLHKMLHQTRNGSNQVLLEQPILSAPPMTRPSRRSSRLSENNVESNTLRRMQDGSIDLPMISQLQRMLTRHSVEKAGDGQSLSVSFISSKQIVSSPIPRSIRHARATAYQEVSRPEGNRVGFESEKFAKQADATTPGAWKGKMDQKRLSGSQSSDNQRRDDMHIGLSDTELRKRIERIFQQELKRYGL